MTPEANLRRLLPAALLGIAVAAASVAVIELDWDGLPKRFAVVVPGQLYRSGSLSPGQLETLARENNIRTVLSLLNPDAPISAAERRAAERLGLRWLNVPLTGDGASTPADRERIKAILATPRDGALLVHCAAGSNRTGLAIGLYRMNQQGWTLEQTLAEMKRFGFRNKGEHQNLRDALATEAAMLQRAATK